VAVVNPTRGLATFAEHEMVQHLCDTLLEDRFLYCPQLGWMEWDGMVWKRHADREGIAVKREFRKYLKRWVESEVTRLLPAQTASLVGYLRIAGLDRLERAAKTVGGMAVEAAWFDRDPRLVNTPSGVVDLLDMSLNPHEPMYGMTRVTGASYTPGATHPTWQQALDAFPDEDTMRWVQAYLGRGLLGIQGGVEFAPFFLGTGQNGKSVIVGSVQRALGGYAKAVESSTLAGHVHEEHIASLRALRLAVVEELSDGHRLNVARLKQMIGTDKMIGRHLFREAMEWTPSHTLVVTSNYLPIVPETDHGTWRRLVGVPFPKTFPLDPGFKEACLEDVAVQEAVLAWLVEGAARPMPTTLPAAVEEHTALWRQSVDLIAQFVDECCVVGAGERVTRANLLQGYNDFIQSLGHKKMTGRTFTERFRDHKMVRDAGVSEVTMRGTRMWDGIALKASVIGGAA
jgi:putative DNA primase/helicase